MILGGSYGSLFQRLALSAIADGAGRSFPIGRFFFWTGFCRRKSGLGGREGYARDGRPVPAPGTSQ